MSLNRSAEFRGSDRQSRGKSLASGGVRLFYVVTFSFFLLVQSRSWLVVVVLLLVLRRTPASIVLHTSVSFLYRDIRFHISSRVFFLSLFSRESHSCVLHLCCCPVRDSACSKAHPIVLLVLSDRCRLVPNFPHPPYWMQSSILRYWNKQQYLGVCVCGGGGRSS